MGQDLNNFFEKFLKKQNMFKDKKVLQSAHLPNEILHRDDQINQIAQILAPALRLERPSNVFIYGKTGTGKTLSIKHTSQQLLDVAKTRNIPLKIVYVNCKLKKIADTEYRLIAELARFFGKAIPPTGLPTDEVYNIFFRELDREKKVVILVLDEIDQLVKKAGDQIIYNLTRINSDLKQAELCLVGISNDLAFANNLDPRVKSSLSEEELVFPPYNALQIQDILQGRAIQAFSDGVLEQGVIQKCAAYAAREHGDIRRALELLRVAGELAERKGLSAITLAELDEAQEKIEKDRFVDVVFTQPKQFQAVLYSIIMMEKDSAFFTGDVYDIYKKICQKANLRPLTQRRVSDVIAELDMLGIINARVISKGRYGRTREIGLSLPTEIEPKIKQILEESLLLT
ncbi:ORC1-type DNA replication protein [Candidatus Woesearchaeota archaeon]|nr:MAG: ORC1-type DNA replication protein [Candidatus Woesearchaeota archaeon]